MKLVFLLLLLTACAAKPIMQKETKDGGRILVLGSKSVNNSNMIKDRDALIKAKCKKGFEIIEQGKMPTESISGGGTLEQYYDFKCKK